MRVGIVRLAMAVGVSAAGAGAASGQQHPPVPAPGLGHGPVIAMPPPIASHATMPPHPTAPGPHLAEIHAPEHKEEGGHGSHHHSEGHDHGHCMPGVYKTEIEHFRGNGFVARKNPFTAEHDTLERAGFPNEVSHRAEPTDGPHYTGYYVGGGASLLKGPGHRRHPLKEGTWGWDYEHLGLKRRVQLLFSRGVLYQDGGGQYEPDPPYEIPNVFAIRYGERLHRLLGHGGE